MTIIENFEVKVNMPKFINIIDFTENQRLLAFKLFQKYSNFISDDYFFDIWKDEYAAFLELLEKTSPYFWIIEIENMFAGFVYLDNWIGSAKRLHSAEVTTCFNKKFWGKYPKICADIFFRYCFNLLGLKKIKAEIYSDNTRVKPLLKKCGFVKEGTLQNQTIKNGKFQDIEIYGLYNTMKGH